jgi:serine protease Do
MTVMSHPGFVLLVWFFVGPLERSPSPAVFPPPVVACLEQARNQEPTSYRAIVQKILPTVVSIEAKGVSVAGPTSGSSSPGNDDFHPYFDHPLRQRKQPAEVSLGIGSGVIIDSQGVVLTSFHVVEGARVLEVRTHDGRVYRTSDIRMDRYSDLALVRFTPKVPLQAAEFGDSDSIEMGDRVLAFGAPFGLRGSVSSGIISAKGRALRPVTFEDYLQTDAPVNPGNSGGPLVNLDGKLIGILTAIKSRSGSFQGVGLAVASNLARRIATELMAHGRVRRGYLGLFVEDLDPDEREKWDNSGVRATMLVPNSPASQQRIQPGDLVIRFQNRLISSSRDFQRWVSETAIGEAITLELARDGRRFRVELKTVELPDELRLAASKP